DKVVPGFSTFLTPAELGQLSNLQILTLDDNQLTQIPAELSRLKDLRRLHLDNNHLTRIPMELGQLTQLELLSVDGNDDLTSLPPEAIEQGTEAILSHLRNGLKQGPQDITAIIGVSGQRRRQERNVIVVRTAERI
ncbi:leucine-rich repeat domain-containing protein, partial [Planctomycetota bacterium]